MKLNWIFIFQLSLRFLFHFIIIEMPTWFLPMGFLWTDLFCLPILLCQPNFISKTCFIVVKKKLPLNPIFCGMAPLQWFGSTGSLFINSWISNIIVTFLYYELKSTVYGSSLILRSHKAITSISLQSVLHPSFSHHSCYVCEVAVV